MAKLSSLMEGTLACLLVCFALEFDFAIGDARRVAHDQIEHHILWKFITRGVMVLCTDNQSGVDIVLPICDPDRELSTSLLVFENGGGGGLLAKMLENLRRLRGTANTVRRASCQSYTRVTLSTNLSTISGQVRMVGASYQIADSVPKFSGMVDEVAEKLYAEVRSDTEALIDNALGVLYPDSLPLSSAVSTSASGPLTIFAHNTTPFARRDIVRVPLAGGGISLGDVLQTTSDGKEGYIVLEGGAGGGLPCRASVGSEYSVLGNGNVQLTVAGGRVTSPFDIRITLSLKGTDALRVRDDFRRELIPHGETGGLIIFEDQDAWDVELHHLEKCRLLKFENIQVVSSGPARGAVEAEAKYGSSTIRVTISLDAIEGLSSNQFIFSAEVDWHERHEFLKCRFRPMHKNTTWDAAKFELCGHKYSAPSMTWTTGFSCQGNVLRILLLPAATALMQSKIKASTNFHGRFIHTGVTSCTRMSPSTPHYTRISGDVQARGPRRRQGNPHGRTVTLRSLRGHASICLRVNMPERVIAAYETNLLEDDVGADSPALEWTTGEWGERPGEQMLRLVFRGFEVKIKVVLTKDA
ncbi:hypothetical protein BGW80DRAFT_1256743 [Lactifluus volemus]|nr:hypothetical protein BGW80DRAFT_1256743 [Lactifluus volemus]